MPKKTLLEITQSVLSSMNSDNVNSINDLEEALQIAEKAREVYEDLMSIEDWEHLRTLTQLEALADSTKPNYLRIPDDVSALKVIRYDVRENLTDSKKYKEIIYRTPEEFLDLVLSRDNTSTTTLEVVDPSGVTLFIRDDIPPSYWTSFDGEYILFDSYDSDIETTLQQSKNLCEAVKEPTFSVTDNFIPDMPSSMFPAYIQEVTRVCSLYFREQPSPNDERRAFRSLANMKNKAGRTQNKRVKHGRS